MIIHRYILRNHIAPFLYSAATMMGVLLLQFLMKFANRLVGKGLDTWLIVQLIAYNLSWMVVLVIPMATLVAALMTYGSLSQNNEVTIIKSSGASLYRMMSASFVASIIVAYLLFLFNNEILPDANHQAKILMSDISRKKPTLSLEPGFFSQEVSNYAILVREIDEQKNELKQVTIYDYTDPAKINVVTAEKGTIFFSNDQKNLIMDLRNGEIHESDVKETGLYRKLVFEKHRITMDAEQFTFSQSQGGLRGERELRVESMRAIVDSIKLNRKKYFAGLEKEVNKYFFNDTAYATVYSTVNTRRTDALIYVRIQDRIKTAKNIIISNLKRIEWSNRQIEKFEVEIYKKYAIPAACIVFMLIGAPLGIMVRKGGFGVAASIGLFFFLIYWAFLIGGEKLAERGVFSPIIGMWAANIFLGIIGIVLLIRTNRETVTIQFTFLKKLVPKRMKYQQ
ncbi:MAG: LptF/LptG family permease [Ignavibacteriaceae bacterium]